MSTDTTSNVIPLRMQDRAGASEHAQQFELLLEECRDLTRERLSQSLAAMLDKAGDTLWELRNATQDRDTQNLYMEAKDKLLPRSKEIGERFCSHYLAEFDDRAGRVRASKPSFSDYKDGSLELGLVGEDDLNETLKVNEMAAKLRGYCHEELVALDQRAGVLLGDANLHADSNPFSPKAICDAFKHTCRDIESDVRIRMVLIKLFDDHVLDDIRSIYKAANALLVQHSILPKIRYGVARNQEGGGGALPAVAAAAAMQAGAALAGPATTAATGEQDVFSLLQGLIAAQAKSMGQPTAGFAAQGSPAGPGEGAIQIGGFPPIFDVPGQADGAAAQALLQGAALLGSLTRIQHGDFSQAGAGVSLPTAPQAGTGATNLLRELKDTSVGTGMGQMEVATLDIMAMLFDQIFDDRKIPDTMKWLIGRLQIPMLKVAILDKTFFSTRTHPARQMLDALGEIAVGLPTDIDSSNPLYKRVEGVVQKLIDGFEDSIDIFDVLRVELQEVVTQENQRVEESTRNTAKRIEEKERLGVAKAVARDEIKARLQSGPMPKVVMKFLTQQWIKLLLTVYAKRGKDSDSWKSSLQTMDDLIWSVRSKPSRDDLRKLAALLPGLLKRLSAGMHIIGTREATRERFLADLMKLHTQAMSGGAVTRTTQASGESSANAGADAKASGPQPVDVPAGDDLKAASSTIADAVPASERSEAIAAKPAAPEKASAQTAALERTAPQDTATQSSAPESSAPQAIAPELTAPPTGENESDSDPTSLDFALLQPAAPQPTAPQPKASQPAAPTPTAPQPAATQATAEDESDSDPASLDFTTVIVKNPFGQGEIQVDEIELPSVPGAPAAAVKEGDKYSQLASGLKAGTWLEFRGKKQRHQVKLSYVSPFKTAYLFVNWQGQTVGEYSLHELAAEMRAGRAVVMNQVPLFDRAMNSLMGALKG